MEYHDVAGLPEGFEDGQIIILQTEGEDGQVQQSLLQKDTETQGDETVVRVLVGDTTHIKTEDDIKQTDTVTENVNTIEETPSTISSTVSDLPKVE